jgi:hypothetical protein
MGFHGLACHEQRLGNLGIAPAFGCELGDAAF